MKRRVLCFELLYLNLCLFKARAHIVSLIFQRGFLALQNRYLIFRLAKTLPKPDRRTTQAQRPGPRRLTNETAARWPGSRQ